MACSTRSCSSFASVETNAQDSKGELSFICTKAVVAIVAVHHTAAFFSVFQPGCTGGNLHHNANMPGLQLREGDIEELRQRLREPCALASEQAAAWLQAVAARIHSATWMPIADTGPAPMATHRGTRPGSSWADIMFAAILRRVLKRRDDARSRDVTPRIPWDGTRNPFVCGPIRSHVALSDTIWAARHLVVLRFRPGFPKLR